jgi:hypothetical protein
MVAQHRELLDPQASLQAGFLVVAQGHAFRVLEGRRGQGKAGLPAEGQHAGFLANQRDASAGRGVQHTTRILSHLVAGAVDGENCQRDRDWRFVGVVAGLVDPDQAAGRDRVEYQAAGWIGKWFSGPGIRALTCVRTGSLMR